MEENETAAEKLKKENAELKRVILKLQKQNAEREDLLIAHVTAYQKLAAKHKAENRKSKA